MEANDLVEKHHNDAWIFCVHEMICTLYVCSVAKLHSFEFFWTSKNDRNTRAPSYTPHHMNWKKQDSRVMPRRQPISIALPILTCSHFSPSFYISLFLYVVVQENDISFISVLLFLFSIVLKGDYSSLVPVRFIFFCLKHRNATI